MRIDSHQHFWNLPQFDYSWIPKGSPIDRSFLPPDLQPILERNRMDGTVLVQAHSSVEEAEWCLKLADSYPFIKGVVGWAPLREGRLGHVLDTLQKHPKFKGVRHVVQDEPDVHWMMQDSVFTGFKELARRGLPYDVLIFPRHLSQVPRIAERVPDLHMVIDHIAKPPIKLQQMDGWARDMEVAAQIPQCYVKLSGMVTEADKDKPLAAQIRPFLQHAYKLFGPERSMYGSDWPVCLLAATYKEVLAAFTQAIGPLPEPVRNQVMGGTAARFYGLS
jgi:L-fuconolactonase